MNLRQLQALNRQVAMNRICDEDNCRELATDRNLAETHFVCHKHKHSTLKAGEYSKSYINWVKWMKENKYTLNLTRSQNLFAEFCLKHQSDIGRIGGMQHIFDKTRDYIKHN